MRIFADFHVHSRYSAATSPEMKIETLADYALMKGINLLGTGDFTHPEYFKEIEQSLEPAEPGLFKLKSPHKKELRFILTVELSHIFHFKGKLRRVHQVVFVPSLEIARKLNQALQRFGNLSADGRPMLSLPAKQLLKMALDFSPECLIVPAHIWTPWFSVLGSEFGFLSMEECYEEEMKNIHAIETGLDSDPAMNWRVPFLDRMALISSSDAHSPSRIGREATLFDCDWNYSEIAGAIKQKDPRRFLGTIELFPQEGKYYWDGHRKCGVGLSPQAAQENDYTCPKCRKKLTLGVVNQLERCATRPFGYEPDKKIPFRSIVPLEEILADAFSCNVDTKKVEHEYDRMIQLLGPELQILLELNESELKAHARPEVVEAILNMRQGKVEIDPGYDGKYGTVRIEKNTVFSANPIQAELF